MKLFEAIYNVEDLNKSYKSIIIAGNEHEVKTIIEEELFPYHNITSYFITELELEKNVGNLYTELILLKGV